MFFGWPMVSDTAVLSGGSWRATLPLSNLQLPQLATAARSTDETVASTQLQADMGAGGRAVRVVALVRHNLRSAAQWRVRGSNASDMSGALYDSGWVEVWGPQWPVGLLPAGHPNAATRRLTDAQIDALDPPRDAVLVLPAEVTARYWRVELNDDSNGDGYVQVGRLVLAPQFMPTYNFSVGAEFGFVDNTQVAQSLTGVRYYDVRPKGRSMAMQFSNLPDAEAYAVVRDMLEELGQAGQVYVVQDAGDTVHLQRRSFLATLRQLSAVSYAAAGYSSVPVVLDEVL
jgi:hypothetical protein